MPLKRAPGFLSAPVERRCRRPRSRDGDQGGPGCFPPPTGSLAGTGAAPRGLGLQGLGSIPLEPGVPRARAGTTPGPRGALRS